MLSVFCAVLVLVPWLLTALPASAAERIEVVSVGWDDTVVPGTWSPVRLRVGADSTDFTGRVEVVVKFRPPSQGRSVTLPDQVIGAYAQDLVLPGGTTKDVTIWVPTPHSQTGTADTQPGTVRLVSSGRVLAQQDVEFRTGRTPQWPLLGVLAEAPVVQRNLARVSVQYQSLPVPVNVAALNPADLPSHSERLRAFKAIVVQGTTPSVMTDEQRAAVRDWVIWGGHLVIFGGPDAPRAAAVLPDRSLSLSFAGTNSRADLSAFARWLGVSNDPVGIGPATTMRAQGGTALLTSQTGAGEAPSDGGDPLIWRSGMGDGSVTVVGIDPGLEPIASWAGTPVLLQRLVDPELATFSSENGYYGPGGYQTDSVSRLQGAVDALPPEAYPSLPAVALILGAFALAVGPVAHIVLRRLDRREWIWLVVPGAAMLMVLALYVVGIGREGRDVLANVVAEVRILPDVGGAKASLVAGYFSPVHRNLTVTAPGTESVQVSGAGFYGYGGPIRSFSGYYPGPYGMGGASSRGGDAPSDGLPFSVVAGRETRIEYFGSQWGMRTVALERELNGIGQITSSLRLEESRLVGTIRNDTSFFLEDAAILSGSSMAKLGSLAPGQTAPVAIDLGDTSSTSPFPYGYMPLSYRLLGPGGAPSGASPSIAMSGPRGFGMYPNMGDMPQGAEAARRARLVDALSQPTGPFNSSSLASAPLTLVAFTRSSLGFQLPVAGSHPLYTLSFVQQRLNLDMEPGSFRLPAALSPAELIAQRPSMTGPSGGPTMNATYRFRAPLPRRATVSALELDTSPSVSAGTPPPSLPRFAPSGGSQTTTSATATRRLYNWIAGSWESLPEGQQNVRIAPADPYVSADGEVRLQTSAMPSPGGPSGLAGVPELVVEGTVPS
jgi:hypothetical protein